MYGRNQNPDGTPINTAVFLNTRTNTKLKRDLSRADFESFVSAVIETKFQRLVPAFALRGGWERWFHAELCLLINNSTQAPGYYADREPPVYAASGYADIAFEDPVTHVASHVVEIKCGLNSATPAQSNKRAAQDMVKLGGDPKTGKATQLKVKYEETARIVLLLIVDDAVPDTTQWDASNTISRLCAFDNKQHIVSYYIRYLPEKLRVAVQ
ncbi:unnamed protein product [Mycena citricolor]|uniref:Uncharacterized protein n=1 Tax=Mycena citricolor TaxID=2018698 RepID=A0AAD2HMH0_9AGAR|nr:unnamed protein product [Mycena citricolor]